MGRRFNWGALLFIVYVYAIIGGAIFLLHVTEGQTNLGINYYETN